MSFISSFDKIKFFSWCHSFFFTLFFSNLFIAFDVKLITNPVKLSLGKGIAAFVSAFLSKLANEEPKDTSD